MRKRSRNQRRRHRAIRREILEPRLLLANDFPFQNPAQRFDVNRDLTISALDALQVINFVGRNGPDFVLPPTNESVRFPDVNGSDTVSSLDALQIINRLGSEQPLLAARLVVDSAPSDQQNLDFLTNQYGLEFGTTFAIENQQLELRIDGSDDDPFVPAGEIPSDSVLLLDESQLDALFGNSIPDGEHRFEARLVGLTEVQQFLVTIDTVAPPSPAAVGLTSDTDTGASEVDGITSNVAPDVQGDADAGTLVSLFVDSELFAETIVASPWRFDDVPLEEGPHSITATATDSAGNASGATELIVVVDTTMPTTPEFNLSPSSDTGDQGDRTTTLLNVDLVGLTEPSARVMVNEQDLSVTAGDTGEFEVFGVRVGLGDNPLTAIAEDLAGNQSDVFQTSITNEAPTGWTTIREVGLVVEQSQLVELGQLGGSRVLSFDLEADFDVTDTTAEIEDIFLVYLVDPSDPTTTLLDRGQPGTALFALAGDRVESLPGLVRFDGQTVEIDVSGLGSLVEGQLLFQLINSDGDTGTQVAVGPVGNTLDPATTASPVFASATAPTNPAGQTDLSEFQPSNDLSLHVGNVRLDSSSGTYQAELQLQNDGTDVGRDVVVVFADLPDGVSVTNASGVDGNGNPYLNFRSAIPNGGLVAGVQTTPVRLEISDPSLTPFAIQSTILTARPNRPPQFDLIDPLTVMPGDAIAVDLVATDPDGDQVTFRLDTNAILPNLSIANDQLQISPKPDDVGTYNLTVFAGDGVAQSSQQVLVDVIADTVTTTRISGTILNPDEHPLAGITIELGGVVTTTAADGTFTLDFGDGPLPGDTLIVRGEEFAGPEVYPFIAEKLPLLFDHDVFASVNNVISRPIFLPALDVANAVAIDPAVDTIVRVPLQAGEALAEVFVGAGSLQDQSGAAYAGELSITEVPIDRTPAALPEGLLPDVVVTIQPGEMVFTEPAPMTLPNRVGYAPDTELELWSINPVTGDFDIVGRGRVSSDGSAIETIEGGIRNSSWHLFALLIPDAFRTRGGSEDGCNQCTASGNAGSEVELRSGVLVETHELVTYQSLGLTRGLTLRYESLWADPRPIVEFVFNEIDRFEPWVTRGGVEDARLIAELSVRAGDFERKLPGYVGDDPFIPDGFYGWRIPEDAGSIQAGLQLDLRDQPTGVYQYELQSGFRKTTFGGERVDIGNVLSVNERHSPFGAGWTIEGLQQITETENGSALLVDGDGATLIFEFDSSLNEFESPVGDFSKLEFVNGSYRRTMPDQTVYQFDPQHRVESIQDRNGNRMTYAYDARGRIDSIVDPVGLATTFQYDDGMVSITDPASRVTLLTLDSDGNLAEIVDPDGSNRSFMYDADSRMLSEIDKRGFVEQEVYGFHGRVERALLADGSQRAFQPIETRGVYPMSRPKEVPFAELVSDTVFYANGNGNVESIVVDEFGQRISSFDEIGSLGSVIRNDDNLPVRVIDGNGNRTFYTYDDRGNVTTITDEISGDLNQAGKVSWIATTDGDWNDGENWSTGEVPGPNDIAVIDVPGADITVTHSGGETTLVGVVASETVVLDGGSITVRDGSTFADLRVDQSAALVADGPAAAISATGVVSVGGGSLAAAAGGRIVLDTVTSIDGADAGGRRWQATGAGSVIDLSNATQITGDFSRFATFRIEALDGGRVMLDGVETINTSWTEFLADGTDSSIGLTSLTTFQRVDGNQNSRIEASNGGIIEAPLLTSLEEVDLVIDGSGTFATSQIVSYLNGQATISGTAADFSGMTDISRSTITLEDGASVNLDNAATIDAARFIVNSNSTIEIPATSYTADTVAYGLDRLAPTFRATGQDAVIDLSGLVEISGDFSRFATFRIEALDGGRVMLDNVETINTSWTEFLANGADSNIGLSRLTMLERVDGNENSRIASSNGGTIEAPLLTSLEEVDLVIDGSGTFATSQIVSYLNGRATITGTTADFSGMTDISRSTITLEDGASVNLDNATSIDATSFIVNANSTLALPATGYVADPVRYGLVRVNPVFRASGANALLDLSGLTSITGVSSQIESTGGGKVDLRAVQTIDAGTLEIMTDGSSSEIDLSSLEQFRQNAGRDDSRLEARNGGTVRLDPVATSIGDRIDVAFDASSSLVVGTLHQETGSSLTGSGNIPGDLVNQGDIFIDGTGLLSVATNFEQGIDGTLNIDIAGAVSGSGFDQLIVSNAATLGGGLSLSVDSEFIPTLGQEFPIATFASRTGQFDPISGADIGNGLVLVVEHRATAVVAVVAAAPAGLVSERFANEKAAASASTDHVDTPTTDRVEERTADSLIVAEAEDVPTDTLQPLTFTYDNTFSQLTTLTDELGRVTLFEVDPSNGNTISITDVVGELDSLSDETDDLTTTFTYTSHGQIDTITDPLGRVTDNDYDEFARLTRITFAVGTLDEAFQEFGYDAAGNQTTFRDENGNITRFEYDALNRQTRIIEADPDGASGPLQSPVTTFTYDADGNQQTVRDARDNLTQFTYDSKNRLLRTIDAQGNVEQSEYDGNGNMVTSIDPLGHVTRLFYDARDRAVETVSPVDGTTSFHYDANNNMTALTDPVGNTTEFMYDPRDRKIAQIDPFGNPMSFRYDAADNLVSTLDRNGRTTTFQYDDIDRLVNETWIASDGETVVNTIISSYDKAGNLLQIADDFSTLQHTYDARNRELSVDNSGTPDAPSVLLAYTYDGVGNVLSVSETIDGQDSAVTSYVYDELNRMTAIQQAGNNTADKLVDFSYNELDQFTRISRYSDLTRSNLVTESRYEYDNLNRLVDLNHTNSVDEIFAFYDFEYDAASRITEIADVDGVTDYTHDDSSRLIGADRSDGDPRGDELYAYDANGNRIESHLHDAEYNTGLANRILSDGTFDYEYDDEGNRIRQTNIDTGEIREFEYDHRNRLLRVTDISSGGAISQQVTYRYDAFNRRISRTLDIDGAGPESEVTEHFVYDRDNVLLDFVDEDGPGTSEVSEIAARYLFGPQVDQVLAKENTVTDETSWLVADHLGTVRDIVDNSGAVINHVAYDSFGNVVEQLNPVLNTRYGFTGREIDHSIELSYYRTRHYDARVGEFTSEDPIGFEGGDTNLFAYVSNRPLDRVDPTGTVVQFVAVVFVLASPVIIYGLVENPDFGEAIGNVIAGIDPVEDDIELNCRFNRFYREANPRQCACFLR